MLYIHVSHALCTQVALTLLTQVVHTHKFFTRTAHTSFSHTLHTQVVHTHCTHKLFTHTVHTSCSHILHTQVVHTYCTHKLFTHTAHTSCSHALHTQVVHTYCTHKLFTCTALSHCSSLVSYTHHSPHAGICHIEGVVEGTCRSTFQDLPCLSGGSAVLRLSAGLHLGRPPLAASLAAAVLGSVVVQCTLHQQLLRQRRAHGACQSSLLCCRCWGWEGVNSDGLLSITFQGTTFDRL